MRVRRFYDIRRMVQLYESRVLSYIEAGSVAFLHAADSVLAPLDPLQRRFLRLLFLDDKRAFLVYNLAPPGASESGLPHWAHYTNVFSEKRRPPSQLSFRALACWCRHLKPAWRFRVTAANCLTPCVVMRAGSSRDRSVEVCESTTGCLKKPCGHRPLQLFSWNFRLLCVGLCCGGGIGRHH